MQKLTETKPEKIFSNPVMTGNRELGGIRWALSSTPTTGLDGVDECAGGVGDDAAR